MAGEPAQAARILQRLEESLGEACLAAHRPPVIRHDLRDGLLRDDHRAGTLSECAEHLTKDGERLVIRVNLGHPILRVRRVDVRNAAGAHSSSAVPAGPEIRRAYFRNPLRTVTFALNSSLSG